MKNIKKLSLLADVAAACYVALCFLRRLGNKPGAAQTIVFSRGAFQRDISSISRGAFLIIIRAEWLRRLMRLGVPDGWLEQVICLSYSPELQAAFPLTLRTFVYFSNRTCSRIVYGGVDYFEIAIFANRELYRSDTTIESVFHENYAIEYVANVNLALYKKITNRFVFDQLYTYGPPATRILAEYTKNKDGPRPMVMPRLASMEDDLNFTSRLTHIDRNKFRNTILLLAFPGSEYLAPLCFTATLLEFARLGHEKNMYSMVKFKNHRSAKPFIRQLSPLGKDLVWMGDGSVESLVWQAGFTVVFNSISLYEALLSPTIIIIPAYLDSTHDNNLLQETPMSVVQSCGEMKSLRFAREIGDIGDIVASYKNVDIPVIVASERDARKMLVKSKFYLKSSNDVFADTASLS